MKLARPKKLVLAHLVVLVSLLRTVTRKNLAKAGTGTALDLQAIADALSSAPLQAWHAEAAAQLKAHNDKRRRRKVQ